jgi:hypothetical protein
VGFGPEKDILSVPLGVKIALAPRLGSFPSIPATLFSCCFNIVQVFHRVRFQGEAGNGVF